MAATALTDLHYLVRPLVRNCPDAVITRWLREAARDFCSRTKIVRETIVLDQVANQQNYELTPLTAESEVVGIKAAQWGEFLLAPVSPEEVLFESGDPYAWITGAPNVFSPIAVPTSNQDDAFSVSVWLQPTITAASIQSAVATKYSHAVALGAMAFLFGQKDAAWGDEQQAGKYEALYTEARSHARYEQDRAQRPRAFRTIPGW